MNTVPKYDEFHFALNAVFQLIEPGKKVLDIGCATGRLAEKLKTEKRCFVVGVEYDGASAQLAQQKCEKVIVADIEHLEEIPYPAGYFDVIVFADILEHLKNPEAILKRLKRYISENGYIIISVPNIANWFIRLKLLLGKWDYKENGILDKTHIKFFTLTTIKAIIKECGYKINYLSCTTGLGWGKWGNRFLGWIDWRMTSNNPANICRGLLAYQFIIKAKKSNNE